jgi:hypothetical protein
MSKMRTLCAANKLYLHDGNACGTRDCCSQIYLSKLLYEIAARIKQC